jgi:hypothetical protein
MGGSRASGALLACVLLSTTACVAIAGVADKAVDPCFDGCGDAGNTPSSNDAILEEGNSPPTHSSSDSGPTPPENDGGTTPDTTEDGGGCPCPTGTQRDGDACKMTLAPSSLRCMAPMQLPNCELKLSLSLCDTDPSFFYEASCAKEPGGASRPSIFLKLGASATGKWRMVSKGPFVIASVNDPCSRGEAPCVGGGQASTTFTFYNVPDATIFAYGKRGGGGCDPVTVEMFFHEQ